MIKNGVTLLGAILAVGCSQVYKNARLTSERQPQATDVLVGSGNIAKTSFRATAVAAVRQPVTTIKLGLVNLWHRPLELVAGNLPSEFLVGGALAETPGTAEFEKMLDDKGFPSATNGSLKWLVDGTGFFPELDRQIASATQSIKVQVYIFDNDDIGVRYADALKKRSAEIPTRVLMDDLGSTMAWMSAPETLGQPDFSPPVDMHRYLRNKSKARARLSLNPWLVCDHTKLLVFDQRSAILGGMNIGREYYSEWHDLMVRVEGPVVALLERDFNLAWRKAGPAGDFARLTSRWPLPKLAPGKHDVPLRVLRTDPAAGRYEIMDSMLSAIAGSKQRVWIESPYFGSNMILAACEAAARRGVDVKVILPAAGDSGIMDAVNLAIANGLIRSGANVFVYPNMAHTKAMICDGWATVGSANLDTLSLRINRELNLAFSDPGSIRGLERAIFLPDLRRSRRLELGETTTLSAALAEVLANQL